MNIRNLSTNCKFMRMLGNTLSIFVILAMAFPVTGGTSAQSTQVCYVKQGASGGNDGTSWADAYTDLQSALGPSTCTEVWVAAGTYQPGVTRTDSFTLKDGVAIYGGFAGTETQLTERDPAINITTLSGDIGTPDNSSDNSYHVVNGGGTTNTAVLDGFTITGGNANADPTLSDSNGGGMYNVNSHPSLTNISFSANLANNGAGIFNDNSSPSLTNVIFSGNMASNRGGGMANDNNSSPSLVNVTFETNSALSTGGGINNNYFSSPNMTNVTFRDNFARSAGGGMYNVESSSPSLQNVSFSGNSAYNGAGMVNASNSNSILTNVTFDGNSAANDGGAFYNWGSNPSVTNVTFFNNLASGNGGGIYNYFSNPELVNLTFHGNSASEGSGIANWFSNPRIRNSILYGDLDGEIANFSGEPIVTYSIVQGGYPGTGNLDADPLLGPLQDNGGFTQTMALAAGSPAIDAGDNENCPSSDQRGEPRPVDGNGDGNAECDIGAFEAGEALPPSSPSLRAHPVWDSVDGWNWPQDATLHMSIEDPNTSISPDLEMDMPGAVDPNVGSVWFDFAGTYDLKPGDIVTMTDGVTTHSLVVSILSIDSVDVEADTVSGTVEPGTQVRLPTGVSELLVTAESNGYWFADFKQISFDLAPGIMIIAEVFDEDGDNSSFEQYISNPRFEVRHEANSVAGWDWQPNAEVNLYVDGVFITTAQTDEGGYFNVIVSEIIDLLPGLNVEVTDGGSTKSHLVSNLSITNVSIDTDIVSGIATPHGRIQAEVCMPNVCIQRWETVDGAGNWSADFSIPGDEPGEEQTFDFVSGTSVDAREWDEDGDNTIAGYYIPNPRFVVFPEWEWFDGLDWPDGATVAITVKGKPECETTKQSWGGFFNGSFGENCDVEIGDTVTFAAGDTTRTHVVQNLAVTTVDIEADIVAGTADEGATIFVWPHATGEQLQVIADSARTWQVNFSGIFDLVPGEAGRSEIRDEIGNATAVDWSTPPPPRIVYRYQQYVVGEHFTPGALLTFSFYESQDASQPLFVLEKEVDEFGGASIPEWEQPYELGPGNYVVVTDGTFTKELVLEAVTMDVFDPTLDLLAGTTSPDRTLYIYAQNDSTYCNMDVTADGNGAWTANFAGTCDITEDMWTAAMAMDEDGDVSEATKPSPPVGYHDYEIGDVPSWACNVGGWAMDPDAPYDDLNVRILVDGLQIGDNIKAENYREDLATAWNQEGGGCPGGTCAFEVNLWGQITSYIPHEITVEAQDLQSEEWYSLSNSRKTLTCRTYDVYTFAPATGGTEQVTNLPDAHEFNPRWSPDNKKIVHDTWSTDWSSHGVYVTDVNTGVSAPLAGAEGGSYPTWSPNGNWIAFDRGTDNDYRLFIVSPRGGTPKLVVEDAFMATWAPNSQRLAFHRPSDGAIWTTDLNGGNTTKVTERGNGPAWSPDGEWLAFEVDGDVWKVRVNSNGNPLGDPIQLTSSPVWEGRPTWSNNSKTIVFHAGMGQDTDIWTISASGGSATWLTGAPVFGDYDPNYSFNGKQIAYSSFSPDGQTDRYWGAAFTSDVGTWSEGEHSYYLENTYSVPELGGERTPLLTFNVSSDAQQYDGFVLLRGYALRTRVGEECLAIDPPVIHPEQNTRFHYGWMTDTPMSYAEALAHFDSLTVKAYWDDGASADLLRHEIFSWSTVDWTQYMCSATAP